MKEKFFMVEIEIFFLADSWKWKFCGWNWKWQFFFRWYWKWTFFKVNVKNLTLEVKSFMVEIENFFGWNWKLFRVKVKSENFLAQSKMFLDKTEIKNFCSVKVES